MPELKQRKGKGKPPPSKEEKDTADVAKPNPPKEEEDAAKKKRKRQLAVAQAQAKAKQAAEERGDGAESGSLRAFGALVFIVTLVTGLVYYQHVNSMSSDEHEFNEMPKSVMRWMQKGQFIPVFDKAGQQRRLFVMNQRSPADSETVLLVPDHHTSSFAFSAAAKAMRGSGTNVVTFDFPGFGLSDPPPRGPAADEAADPDAAAIKTLKSVVTMLKLRTFHLVLQGSSARIGIKFARELRARVRSVALCGTDRAGFAAFKIPPCFGSSLGNRALTSLPGLSSYTAAWFRSRGAPVYDAALVEATSYLRTYRGGLEHFVAAEAADTAAKAVCAADAGRSPCDTAFSTSLRDLNLDFAAVFADSAGTVGMVKVAAGRPESFGDLGFPAEADPGKFAEMLKALVAAQEPTPEAPPEKIPAHVQAQLDAGHGHSHDHGGGGHGHGHGGHDHSGHDHDHGHHDHHH